MYLLFDEITEKIQLKDFKATHNYTCFAFENEVSTENFSDVVKFKMYSDDDMFLSEYILKDYKLVCNGNELYLKDKDEVIDLDFAKTVKIAESKDNLAEWLAANPMTYTDGKQYSVTAEKQSLLNSNLASYERAKAAGIPYPLKWNATGEECREYSYEELVGLSLSIAAYVAHRVSQQQELEIAINTCETVEELDKVVISYE